MKGWKTVAFGVLLAGVAILSNADMQAFISQHIPAIGGSLGVIVIALRAVTNTDIFKGA